MSVMANGWGSRERARLALKRMHPTPKHGESSMALSTFSQSDDDLVDARSLDPSGGSSPNDGPKRSIMRLYILFYKFCVIFPTRSNKAWSSVNLCLLCFLRNKIKLCT